MGGWVAECEDSWLAAPSPALLKAQTGQALLQVQDSAALGTPGCCGPSAHSSSTSPHFSPESRPSAPAASHPALPRRCPQAERAPSHSWGGQRHRRAPVSPHSTVSLPTRAVFARWCCWPPHAAFPSRSLPACLLTVQRQEISRAALSGTSSATCIPRVPIPSWGSSQGPQAQPDTD